MPFEDNKINIDDLQNVSISVGDLRALVTVLEAATSHLIIPDEAATALARLQRLAERK
jgi:hypothetical protein